MDFPAGQVYGARLVVRGRLPRFVLVLLAFIRNVVAGALDFGEDKVAPARIEVFRLHDGTVVGEIAAGSHYYEQLERLAVVQRGLENQSPQDFLGSWQLHDS